MATTTTCACDPRPWAYTNPPPQPDEDCPAHGDPAITGQVADRAAATVNHGLARAFLRLGPPPTDRATEQ